MTRREHPRRRLLGRRAPGLHRAPVPAPDTPDEVLQRAPDGCSCATLRPGESCPAHPFDPSAYKPADDVSRETWAELEAALDGPAARAAAEHQAAMQETRPPFDPSRYVAGGQVPDAPPLRKDQVARLEALTAQWERQVRLEDPPDATMLYAAPRPPVPPRPRATSTPDPVPADPAPEAGPDPVRGPTFFPESDPVAEGRARANALEPPRRVSDWVPRHDPRSLEFAVRAKLARPVPLQDLLLERGPVLDQGTTPPLSLRDASACTGMAAVAARNVLELESAPTHVAQSAVTLLDAEDAREAYSRAQELDHVSGEDYAGTSVLAVMKAGQEAGWWDSYLWALGGTRDIAQVLLQLRAPVVLGIPWPAGMETPDADGVVTPTGEAGMGHAVTVVGLRITRASGPGPWFVLQQSRGPAEGDGGLVYVHHTNLRRLLAGVGEAAVPLPRWGLS